MRLVLSENAASKSWHGGVLACALIVACVEGPLDGPPMDDADALSPSSCSDPIVALRVDPPESAVEAGDGRNLQVEYRAIATLESGRQRSVAAAWWLDPPEIGSVDPSGVFSPSGSVGGRLDVRARAGGVDAIASLAVKLVARYFDGQTPADRARLFSLARPRVPDGGLALASPIDGTVFRGEDPARFQWERAGYAAFRLRFIAAETDVSIYTDADAIDLPAEVRGRLARSTLGKPIRVVLEASGLDASSVRITDRPTRVSFCGTGERCNGADDDCDAVADESCVAAPPPPESPLCE